MQRITLEQFLLVADGPESCKDHKDLHRVLYNSPASKTSGASHKMPCDPLTETVERALGHLERQDWPQYDVVKNNCEHFAVYCKTGQRKSLQVSQRLPGGLHGIVGGGVHGVMQVAVLGEKLGQAVAHSASSRSRSRSTDGALTERSFSGISEDDPGEHSEGQGPWKAEVSPGQAIG